MADIKDASEIPEVIDPKTDKVHTWPHLVRIEFICGLLAFMGLLVWSLVLDAPLEEPADPTKTPNPSKAPWYFLGLQEILVYFDPWMAGVVLPSLIIVGLMVIPYIDVNPKGNGYYTW
ncbi:cytochrome C, partial [bacterium]